MTNVLGVLPAVELIEIAATVSAACFGVVAILWRWAKKIESQLDVHDLRFEELKGLHDSHKKRLTKIEQVVMLELTANGGASMKDRIDKIEQVTRIMNTDN